MTKKEIKAALCRLREMLTGSVIMSVTGCLFCVSGFMPVESVQRDILLAVLPIIYIVWNVFVLRDCYAILKKAYCYINVCATALFMIISATAFAFFPRKLYSWLFLATCLGGFSNLGISGKSAILLFYAVITVSIFLAPIGMSWVYRSAEEEYVGKEMIPPRMDEEKVKAANKALGASADKNHSNSLQ